MNLPFHLSDDSYSFSTRLTKALLIGLLTAVLGACLILTPFGTRWEEDLGLSWLFQLRGPRPAPDDVVIVTTDRESAYELGLPQEPWKWPRSLHGDLVRTMATQGATAIAFDLFFKDAGDPVEDGAFAEGIREAGNVVLFEKMTTPGVGRQASDLIIRMQPTQRIAEPAAALAPFPLPAVPFRVNRFWLFEPSEDHLATLPMAAFQLHTLSIYGDLVTLFERVQPDIADRLPAASKIGDGTFDLSTLIGRLRTIFRADASLAKGLLLDLGESSSTMTGEARQRLSALIQAYGYGDSAYLDFYGPPRTVTTIRYSCVLRGCPDEGQSVDLEGKTVFVGFSEQVQAEQKDRFHTVFTSDSGLYLSGVEIAATAFGNLLEGRHVTPLTGWEQLWVLAGWGLLLSGMFAGIPPSGFLRRGGGLATAYILSGMALGAAYFGTAYGLFVSHSLWLPLVIPLLIQLPVALIATLFWRYREAQRERQNVQQALEHYVPPQVALKLTRNIEAIRSQTDLVEGICLATDAENYTVLAETMELQELRAFMNDYYATVFEPVRSRGGIVSDVIGDAVLAIWTAPRLDTGLKQRVCEAALDIVEAVRRFNQQHPDTPLPIRIGLHGGRMLVGNVGAMDHYEYRAVGDIVSTATRIEGLNKYLGTRLLASHAVVENVDGVVSRELGWFQLAGKRSPILIHEVRCREHEAELWHQEAVTIFGQALQAFYARDWNRACDGFDSYLDRFGQDGPSRYYLDLCRQYLVDPPTADWSGVVALTKK